MDVYSQLEEVRRRLEAFQTGFEMATGGRGESNIQRTLGLLRKLLYLPHEIKIDVESNTIFIGIKNYAPIEYIPSYLTRANCNLAIYPAEPEAMEVIRGLHEFYTRSRIAELSKEIGREVESSFHQNKKLRETLEEYGRKKALKGITRGEELEEEMLKDKEFITLLIRISEELEKNGTVNKLLEIMRELQIIGTAYYLYLVVREYIQPHYLSRIAGDAKFKLAGLGPSPTLPDVFFFLLYEAEMRCGNYAPAAISLYNRMVNLSKDKVEGCVMESRSVKELEECLSACYEKSKS